MNRGRRRRCSRAARDAGRAARRASRRRAARRAGTRRGSTSGRRRASAARSSGAPDGESTPASRSDVERPLVDVDVQLVARRPVERLAAVGADLRAHAEVAQQRERAACGRRARRDRGGRRRCRPAGARRRTRGRAPRARPAGSSAAAARSAPARRGGRRRATSRADAFEREQPPLVLDAEVAVGADPVRADDAVRRDERRERAAPAERAGGARGARVAGERRELAVGDDLAARHLPQRAGAVAVEPVRDDAGGTSGKSSASPAKNALQPRPQASRRRPIAASDTRTRRAAAGAAREWKTRPPLEPDLAHAPAGRVVLHERRPHSTRCCSFARVTRAKLPALGYALRRARAARADPRHGPPARRVGPLHRRRLRLPLVPREPARAARPLRPGRLLRERRRARRRRLPRAAGARAPLGRARARRAGLGLCGDRDHRLVARRVARPQDRRAGSARPASPAGSRCSRSGSSRARPAGRSPATRVFASSLGFMVWVLVTATYLLRR